MVVTDIRMPPTGTDEGIRAAEELRRPYPNLGFVVLSQYSEPAYALVFSRRVKGPGLPLKERVSDIGQFASAIREVARGGSVIDPEVVDNLVKARSQDARSPLRALTPREVEVLAEMAQGKNNAAVAAALVLSERAVEKHINSIFFKLGLSEETRRAPPGQGRAPFPGGHELTYPARARPRGVLTPHFLVVLAEWAF